jgi:hypothetical protein
VGWWGWMLLGAFALGGLILVGQNFFPNLDRQTVAAFGAFLVAAIIVLGTGFRSR